MQFFVVLKRVDARENNREQTGKQESQSQKSQIVVGSFAGSFEFVMAYNLLRCPFLYFLICFVQ